MKSIFSLKTALFAIASFTMAGQALAQVTENYEHALSTGTNVIVIHPDSADVDPSLLKSADGNADGITRTIDPSFSKFQTNKLSSAKTPFAVEVRKNDGKVYQITQARNQDGKAYTFETLSVGKDTYVTSYTICNNFTVATAGTSDCLTITPALCASISALGINKQKLNDQLASCSELSKTFSALKSTIENKDLKIAEHANIELMNNSSVKDYIFNGSTISSKAKPLVAIEFQNQMLIDQLAVAQQYDSVCQRMKDKNFMTFTGYEKTTSGNAKQPKVGN